MTDDGSGSWILGFRLLHGLTQAELAAHLGVQPETISRWESDAGQRPQNPKMLRLALETIQRKLQ